MNVKKTIATIAAIATVASATSLAPLFTGTSISAEETETVATDTDADPEEAEIEQAPALQTTTSISPTVDGMTSGSGTATGEVDGDTTTVTVSLTDPEGAPQNGASNGTPNYHVTIPIGDISGWKFDGGYIVDSNENPEWNLSSDGLKLWLPVPAAGQSKTHTIIIKSSDNSQTKTIVITAQNGTPVVTPTLTVADGGTTDSVTGGSGSVAVDGTTVTVTLTPNDGETIGGQPENGVDSARENYHVVIPVTGLDSSWTFDSTSEYGYDNNSHTDWNITDGHLKLWLPVASGTCKVVLVKNDTKVTINVTTVNGSTVVTPPPAVTEPTDEAKVEEAFQILANGYYTWEFDWIPVSELDIGAAERFASTAQEQVGDLATISLDHYVVGENGMVTFYLVIESGDHAVISDITVQCKAPAPVVTEPTPEPVYDPVIYVPSTPASVSYGAAAVTTVSSSKEIAASRRSDITVNAAETDVTPAMVQAFVKNRNAKTLTLKYSSTLKVAVAKKDISDTSADLDFSVSGKKFLSSKTIKNNKTLKNATKLVQLDFVNKGELDGVDKVTIKSNVGVALTGSKVTVYEYVNGKLVKVCVTSVNGAGLVKFDTDHLGQFVIAVQ